MSNGWDETFDIVTVGSGGGAMTAALVAHSQSKKVVVLEKEAKFGGSSSRSGGAVWIPFNHLMQKEGIQDNYTEARKYVDACVVEYTKAATPARIDAYLNTGPEMLKFLMDQGMEFRRVDGYCDYYDDRPGGSAAGRAVEVELLDGRELGEWQNKMNRFMGFAMPVRVSEFANLSNATRTWAGRWMGFKLGFRMMLQKLRGAQIFGQGTALQGRMLQQALKRGIDIRLETPVTDLVVENGAVVGVVAKHNGKQIRIRATSGVLLNAGGFSFNMEMRKQHLPSPQNTTEFSMGNPGDTGDAIRAAVALGADTDQMNEAWWVVGSVLPGMGPTSHTIDLSKPHCILVDAAGQRFLDEAMAYMELGQTMYAHNKKIGAVPSWAIFDSNHRNRYTWGAAMPGITPKAWIDSGYMKRADTLEDLARQCNLAPAALKATVERFNGFARQGRDDDFKRGNRQYERMNGDPTNTPNPTLGTVEKGPFYAVQIHVGDVGTCGGLVTDVDARVLKENGSPIPGLYAFGNSAANCFGRSYPGPGITLGQTFIFGYRAARHALRVNT